MPGVIYAARRHCLRAILFVCLATASLTASAGQLRIVPTLVQLSWPNQATLVRVENSGDASVSVQLRVFAWDQESGDDKLLPTQDVIASPPIATIKPGTTQSIRLIRNRTDEATEEQAYRLLIDELPPSAEASGVRVLLRYALPVFVGPAQALAFAPPRWSLQKSANNTVLVAHNPGEKRVRVTRLSLSDGQNSLQPLGPGLVGYVLAGQTMRWPLPNDINLNRLKSPFELQAQSEWGALRAPLDRPSRP